MGERRRRKLRLLTLIKLIGLHVRHSMSSLPQRPPLPYGSTEEVLWELKKAHAQKVGESVGGIRVT